MRCHQGTSFPDFFKVNGTTISDKNEIAAGFNNFFVNIGPNLANNTVSPSGDDSTFDYMKALVTDSMFLFDTYELEIAKIIRECKPKKSTGYDGINMNIIKSVIKSISKPVVHICNLSLSSGIFPDYMKIARVIPLYKPGEKDVFTNYRPVSLLPQF